MFKQMRFNLKFLTTIFSLTLLVSGFFVFNNVEAESGTDTTTPTATVTQSGNSTGGTIVYTFSEPVQLMNSDKTEIIDAVDYINSLGIYELNDYSTHVYGQSDVTKVGDITSATLSDGDAKMTIEYTGNLEGKIDMQYVVDAWGNNITDKAGNKMLSDMSQVFTVKAEAPTFTKKAEVNGKTITYTFSEPMQLVKQDLEPSKAVPVSFDEKLLGIYAVDASYNYGPSTKADVTITGTLNSNVLEVTYTGNLEKTSNTNYVIDTWGYDITDLAGNKIDKSELIKALFEVKAIDPIVSSISHIASSKTITYTFSEDMKLVDQATGNDTTFDKGLLGIYAINKTTGDYTKTPVVAISDATLVGNILTVKYTGNIPTGTYLIDAWGYNITDLAGNKIEKSLELIPSQTFTVEAPGNSSSSGSSGSYQATPAIPAQHVEDCKPGEKFNTSTGKSCTIKANPATPGKVLGAEKYNFTKLLKKGLNGDEVIELQKYLISLGYDLGTADGKFGSKTKAAVIKFQLANNLKGDGVIGALTRAILNK